MRHFTTNTRYNVGQEPDGTWLLNRYNLSIDDSNPSWAYELGIVWQGYAYGDSGLMVEGWHASSVLKPNGRDVWEWGAEPNVTVVIHPDEPAARLIDAWVMAYALDPGHASAQWVELYERLVSMAVQDRVS